MGEGGSEPEESEKSQYLVVSKSVDCLDDGEWIPVEFFVSRLDVDVYAPEIG